MTKSNTFPEVEVCCNLCGSWESECIHTGPDRLLNHPGTFTVVQCRRCGLIYQNPRPADIAPFYEGVYAPFEQAEPSTDTATGSTGGVEWEYYRLFQQAVDLPSGQLLDVGCARGDFLVWMHRYGWEVAGCDVHPESVAITQRRLQAAGVEQPTVRVGALEEAAFPDNSFDVVTLWHSLEHVPDPLSTLREVRRVLRPGGLVLIQIPAWLSLESRLWGKYWSGFDCPRHLYMFSPTTLSALLTKAGFQEQRSFISHLSYYIWLISLLFFLRERLGGGRRDTHLADRIYHALHMRPIVRICSPFFRVVDYIGLGSTVTMSGKKNV